MAFTPYHNIVGSTAQDNELVAVNDIKRNRIKSIQITNLDGALPVTVDLYLFKDSTDTSKSETYYFFKGRAISGADYWILDNEDLLNFDNTTTGYSLHIHVGSSDSVDVMIRI